jgi:dihydroorotase-like cyclic amidohydrolase
VLFRSTYSTINHLFPKLKDEAIANLLSNHARQIFNLGKVVIQEGQKIDLTLFNRETSNTPLKVRSKSKSANNPFWDKALKGNVVGTYAKGKLNLNNE